MNKPASGFTLLELLIAIAIFAVVGVMAYGGLNTVIKQSAIVQNQTTQLEQTQAGLRQMRSDLSFALDRAARDALSGEIPEFAGGGLNLLTLTRLGAANPWDKDQSQLELVRWRVHQGNLERAQFIPADGAIGNSALDPDWHVLLRGVNTINLLFFDTNNQSMADWPPMNQPTAGLPKAIEVQISLENMPPLRMTVAPVADWPAPIAPPAPPPIGATADTEPGGGR